MLARQLWLDILGPLNLESARELFFNTNLEFEWDYIESIDQLGGLLSLNIISPVMSPQVCLPSYLGLLSLICGLWFSVWVLYVSYQIYP